MSFLPGARLGAYEILGALGAGGMGEVYRARDTKLHRDVAIKILPEAFAADPDRLARFTREAQTLAALNHPNIAQIYGLEGDGSPTGIRALVMELVAGEDLSERIARGPIPLDEALPIARQIADALEAAHEQGIIHRDLKPGNVKVRPDGTVKVLDFGLAKAMDPAGASGADAMKSPTLTARATQMGTIIGTAAYMAPEQAKGKAVDKRADIWAFGVVLYEMLTGRRLFEGETVSDTLAAVLRADVDWSALPAGMPDAVRTLLRRCLERDAKQRLRDIGEAWVALGEPSASAATSLGPKTAAAAGPWRSPAVWAALALVGLASALAVGAWARLRPPAPQAVTRLSIPLPPGQVLAGNGTPAVSRDGRRIAYVAREPGGESRLYLRALERFASEVVQGSEDAQQPFFSPDGARVAFFARGKLLTASVSGGAAIAIADASYFPVGGSWGDDDAIVFVPALGSGLLRIPSAGGQPQQLTVPDEASGGYAHVWPQVLPGARSVLFTIWGGLNAAAAGSAVLSLETRTRSPVLPSIWSARYAQSGHVLLSGPRGVMAAPFDLSHPQSTRAQAFVLDEVFALQAPADSWLSVSDSGTLVYAPGVSSLSTFAWVDRQGVATPIGGKAAQFLDPSLSPDGTRVLIEEESVLWTVDLRRGTRSRLTLENEGMNAYAAWSRDGARVIFSSNRGGDWDLYSMPAGGGPATRLLVRKGNQQLLSEAKDGTLLFGDRSRNTGADLWTLSKDGKASPFLVSPASKVGGQFSPDGRTIAYVSDETARDEVNVRSFARPGDAVVVSTDGGRDPRWAPDGKELFYRRGDAFMAATVSTADGLSVGDSRKLFEIRAAPGRTANHAGYAVAPDGRFLVLLLDPRAIPTQINVVLNWFEELTAKVPSR